MLHGRGLKTDMLIAGWRHAGVSAYTDMWKFRTGAIDEEPCGRSVASPGQRHHAVGGSSSGLGCGTTFGDFEFDDVRALTRQTPVRSLACSSAGAWMWHRCRAWL